MPPENTSQVSHNNKNVLFLVLLFIALLVVMFFLMKSSSRDDSQGPESDSANGIIVNKVDISGATTADERLPAGFPRDIPVDTTEVLESLSADYTMQGVTQYSVSYWSNDLVSDVLDQYETYMANNFYVVSDSNRDAGSGNIYGTKDNNDLSVVVSMAEGKTLVKVGYVTRQ